MKNNQKTNQLGRSMTEIICVLAIIGIITVATVDFTKDQRDQYIADKTGNEVAMHAVIAKKLLAIGQNDISVPANTMTKDKNPVTVTTDNELDAKGHTIFYITLTQVHPSICEKLVRRELLNATAVVATPADCSDSKNNTLTYQFSGKLMNDNSDDILIEATPTP